MKHELNDDRLLELQSRLLPHGGERIGLMDASGQGITADLSLILSDLLKLGRFWPTDGIGLIPGPANRCHKNAYDYYDQHTDTHRLVTGFALGARRWFWHSWVAEVGADRILEVTVPKPLAAYYGHEVSGERLVEFFARHFIVAGDDDDPTDG